MPSDSAKQPRAYIHKVIHAIAPDRARRRFVSRRNNLQRNRIFKTGVIHININSCKDELAVRWALLPHLLTIYKFILSRPRQTASRVCTQGEDAIASGQGGRVILE